MPPIAVMPCDIPRKNSPQNEPTTGPRLLYTSKNGVTPLATRSANPAFAVAQNPCPNSYRASRRASMKDPRPPISSIASRMFCKPSADAAKPVAKPAKMPGNASAAGPIDTSDAPTAAMFCAATMPTDDIDANAAPVAAMRGVRRSRFDANSRTFETASLRTRPPESAANADAAVAAADELMTGLITATRGRVSVPSFAAAAPVSASALTVHFRASSSFFSARCACSTSASAETLAIFSADRLSS